MKQHFRKKLKFVEIDKNYTNTNVQSKVTILYFKESRSFASFFNDAIS